MVSSKLRLRFAESRLRAESSGGCDNSFLPGLAPPVELFEDIEGAFAATFSRDHIELHRNVRQPFAPCRNFQSGQRFGLKQTSARFRKQACPETGSTLSCAVGGNSGSGIHLPVQFGYEQEG